MTMGLEFCCRFFDVGRLTDEQGHPVDLKNREFEFGMTFVLPNLGIYSNHRSNNFA